MVEFFCPKGLFGCVISLRACLAKFLGYGMLPCFDPMKRPDFGIDFQLGKRENLD